MDEITIEWIGMTVTVLFVVFALGKNDIIRLTIERNQTLRTYFKYLPQSKLYKLKLRTVLSYIPERVLTDEEKKDIQIGIVPRLLFWLGAIVFFVLLSKLNAISLLANTIMQIGFDPTNTKTPIVESVISFVCVFLLLLVSTLLGSKFVAVKRMVYLKRATIENETSMFEYARNCSDGEAIKHIEENLDNSNLIKSYTDMYVRSGKITSQCANVLKAVYLNDNKHLIKIRRWQVTFRTLGVIIVVALILLVVLVYGIFPFL